jgi:hypothetical protein
MSRLVFQPSLVTTSKQCAPRHARTSGSTRPSLSFSGSSGPAASRPKVPKWRREPGAPRCRIVSWMPSVYSVPRPVAGNSSQRFASPGIDLPIIVPAIGVEGARAVIQAFRR